MSVGSSWVPCTGKRHPFCCVSTAPLEVSSYHKTLPVGLQCASLLSPRIILCKGPCFLLLLGYLHISRKKKNSYAKLNLWPLPTKPTPPKSCLRVTLFLQFSGPKNLGAVLLSHPLLTLPRNPISKYVQTWTIIIPLLLYGLGLSSYCILPLLL